MSAVTLGAVSWERMAAAVDAVRRRLERATSALKAADVPYALVGGQAVAALVSRVDATAVRTTRDVDLLLRPSDPAPARQALEAAGFVYRHVAGLDRFLDGPQGSPREAVHLVLAGRRVRPDHLAAAPDVDQVEDAELSPLTLQALLQMKLVAFRDKDRVHLRDLVDVGLVDGGWLDRLPPPLAARLQEILDSPEG